MPTRRMLAVALVALLAAAAVVLSQKGGAAVPLPPGQSGDAQAKKVVMNHEEQETPGGAIVPDTEAFVQEFIKVMDKYPHVAIAYMQAVQAVSSGAGCNDKAAMPAFVLPGLGRLKAAAQTGQGAPPNAVPRLTYANVKQDIDKCHNSCEASYNRCIANSNNKDTCTNTKIGCLEGCIAQAILEGQELPPSGKAK